MPQPAVNEQKANRGIVSLASMQSDSALSDQESLKLQNGTDYLEHQLAHWKRSVDSVAHSWGTYLGMIVIARHPELYHAYVGIGQLARSSPIAAIQDEYIRQSARRARDQDAIRELKEKDGSVRKTLLFKFGGELHHATSFLPLLLTLR